MSATKQWFVGMGFAALLAGCGQSQGAPAPMASAPPAASGLPTAPTAPVAPKAAPVLARKSTPTARRKADEADCEKGNAEACRRMADRFRGYGHPSGCGIDRGPPTKTVKPKDAAAFVVRSKRLAEDTAADERGYVAWLAKACDAGDANACSMEKSAAEGFSYAATGVAEDFGVRSDPSSVALLAWHKATRPKAYKELAEAQARCVASPSSCETASWELYHRGDVKNPTTLEPALQKDVEAILEKTLDSKAVFMMLDKNGFTPELLAPLRAFAAKLLEGACLEGSCVCGEALLHMPPDDPRALDLARMGCENGEAEGCYALGRLYEEGRAVPKDAAAARALYEIACPPIQGSSSYNEPRNGDLSPRACDKLAEIYEGGEMPPKDLVHARFYAERACTRPGLERDHAPCVRLARYWASGAIKSDCVVFLDEHCPSNSEEAALRFYGPNGRWKPPVDGLECTRPSVKPLCDAHKGELDAMLRSKTP